MRYREKLKDPRWQKKRLEIFNRDNFTCQHCKAKNISLQVHHKAYREVEPWDYPDHYLVTLCEDCHEEESQSVAKMTRGLSDQIKVAGATALDVVKIWGAFLLVDQAGKVLKPYQWTELSEIIENYIKTQLDNRK